MSPAGTSASFTLETVPDIRASLPIEDVSGFPGVRQDIAVPGYRGDPIDISVFTPSGVIGPAPLVYFVHGGGMMFGHRFDGLGTVFPAATPLGAIIATVGYRLAPEHPDPYPVEDAFAALRWVALHAEELGVDPNRIAIVGGSAGAGIAAGVALLARDRGGPALAGQLLMYPMLDDRDASVSTRQFDGIGIWDRANNVVGWTALLGDRRGTDDVSIYAAPARAVDASGLPPTFIDVGSAEVFRDECVAFAARIWADGGVAELHVWPGGTHGWEVLAPDLDATRLARAARLSWLAAVLQHGVGG